MPGVPTQFEELLASIRTTPPTLGEHTDEILDEYGYSTTDIEAFRTDDIV